jgi:hypothetical protein
MRRRLTLLCFVVLLAGAQPASFVQPEDSGWGADKCLLFQCPND